MNELLHDATFLTAVLDAVSTIGLYAVGAYFPQYADLTKVIWGSLQPIFLSIIAAISQARAQNKQLTEQVRFLTTQVRKSQ